jgi:hypothetical protein
MLQKRLLAIPFILITGCAEVQVAYSKYKDGEEMKYIDQAKISCERFGFARGTDAFSSCVDKNVNAEKDRDALKAASFHSDSKK